MPARRSLLLALLPAARASSRATTLLALVLLCPASVVADAGPPCLLDDALSNAAASLLLAGRAPDSRALVAAVRQADSDAVSVHALFLPREDPAVMERWLRELRAGADAPLACGDARGEAGRLLVASARGGTLAPLTAASTVIRGALLPGFDHPEVVISSADGTLTRLGVEPSMLSSGIPLAEDVARPATIQLLARGASGPRPIAERVLPSQARSLSTGPAAAYAAFASPSIGDEVEASAAARVLSPRVSALRRDHGRLDVRDNRLLFAVASAHAREVCEQGKLAHELVPGRDPEARVREAGLRARLVGETIGRAADAGTAFAALTESPSHLLTLTEPRFTDVGIGVARDGGGRSCVVVVLAAWPRYVGR